jgi:hypothetical protein
MHMRLLIAALLFPASLAVAQARTSIADSAQNLNRNGMWWQAFDLASRHISDTSSTRAELCGLHVSRTYAALRLGRKVESVAAYDAAKAACTSVGEWMDNQLKGFESELMRMPDPVPLPPIEEVVIHPIHQQPFMCSEHRQLDLELGDRFGADCLLADRYQLPDRSVTPMTFFKGTGAQNEDWFGWGVDVLAPFDGVVESVTINPVDNVVGRLGNGAATAIVFLRADSVRVVY